MSKARKQHFIPVSYLERFTSKGEIYSFDIVEKKVFQTKPINIAHLRDFYTVDHKDKSKENVVEEYFSEIEGRAKPILEQWIKTMKLPIQKEWHILSEFIAGMSLRVPEFRKKYLEINQYMADLTVHLAFSSEEAYKRTREQYFQNTGNELNLEYEEAKRICENPSLYQIVLHPNKYISTMMKCIPEITQIIVQMTPMLLLATDKYRFITSDNPVVMINGSKNEPTYMSCGWRIKNVLVYFPISPFTCIILLWGKEYTVLSANDDVVTSVNSHLLWHSTRYVYSEREQLGWYKGGKIYCDNELLFNELSDTKKKKSSSMYGPIPQTERSFDLNLIRRSTFMNEE